MALQKLSYTDVQRMTAVHTKGFLGIQTCGFSSIQEGAEVENGQIASPCSVVLWEQELDGSGTPRIACGQRFIRTISDDGFTLTLVRKLGTNHSCTLKVGVRVAHPPAPC